MCIEPLLTSGKQSHLLYYPFYKLSLSGGELVNFTAGCEYHGYSTYVSRTWPVSGEFSDYQKAIYEIVYKAYIGGINRLRIRNKPYNNKIYNRMTLNDLYKVVIKIISQELFQQKILKCSSLKYLIERKNYLKVFPHHISNWVGLDPIDTPTISFDTPLQPGNTFSFCTALYLPPKLSEIAEEYRGISIKIGNIIEINQKGDIEILTNDIPIV